MREMAEELTEKTDNWVETRTQEVIGLERQKIAYGKWRAREGGEEEESGKDRL